MEQTNGAKASRLRSPAYPGINLETAISRAKDFYAKERRNSAHVAVAVQHWGFNPSSGGAYIVVAALRSFGLFDNEGSGKDRKVRLSSQGLRIVLDDREDSPERAAAIKEAALTPKIHARLWRKYGAHLPSDPNLRHELIFEWRFNENSVDSFIQEYRDTIAFAKLNDSDNIPLGSADSDVDDQQKPIRVGDYVQWESLGVFQFVTPRRVQGLSDDGQWAFVEGSSTGLPINELTAADPPSIEAPSVPGMKGKAHPPPPPSPFPPEVLKSARPPGLSHPIRQDIFSLSEGIVSVQWPASLSAESFEDLGAWLDILKRKIGRSVTGKDARKTNEE